MNVEFYSARDVLDILSEYLTKEEFEKYHQLLLLDFYHLEYPLPQYNEIQELLFNPEPLMNYKFLHFLQKETYLANLTIHNLGEIPQKYSRHTLNPQYEPINVKDIMKWFRGVPDYFINEIDKSPNYNNKANSFYKSLVSSISEESKTLTGEIHSIAIKLGLIKSGRKRKVPESNYLKQQYIINCELLSDFIKENYPDTSIGKQLAIMNF